MLQLVFSRRDPLKSTVTDASTGQLVYDIKTPFKLAHHTTTIHDAQGQLVAQYEQVMFTRTVTIRGCQLDFDSQFAPKKHAFSMYVLADYAARRPRTPDAYTCEFV